MNDYELSDLKKCFSVLSGTELVDMKFQKLDFCVDEIIPTGLTLLCGSPKVGKSWLSLAIAIFVSVGDKVLGFNTKQGTALYLCLEDTYNRIQDRVFSITDDLNDNIFFCKSACSLQDGLLEQMKDFISKYPDTNLIIIDTLQKVRNYAKDISYGNDYAEMVKLKEFADKNKISVILVHHLRKQNDSDVVNMISGTNGLSGAADTILILSKSKRNSTNATLYCVGRDIEERELELQFDKTECIWKLISDSIENPEMVLPKEMSDLVLMMKSLNYFDGSNAEFLEEYNRFFNTDISSKVLKRLMNKCRDELENLGVYFENYRTGQVRSVKVWYDDNDINDDKNDSGKNDVTESKGTALVADLCDYFVEGEKSTRLQV